MDNRGVEQTQVKQPEFPSTSIGWNYSMENPRLSTDNASTRP